MNDFLKKIRFPYPSLREGQLDFLKSVYNAIDNRENLIVNAPTGLGKTISALAPAIFLAKEYDLKVICLTSRQTQINQIINTIKDINATQIDFETKTDYMAFAGKRNMCIHENKDLYPATDFNDFCKKAKEEGKCPFYKNIKNEDYQEKINSVLTTYSENFLNMENFVTLAKENKLCPYELASIKASKAKVIICDYNYLFSAGIKETFLGKIGKPIEECILIIDEAHNLPDRIRNSYSYTLSTELLSYAKKELNDFIKSDEFDGYIDNLITSVNKIASKTLTKEKHEAMLLKTDLYKTYLPHTSDYKTNLFKIIDKFKELEMIIKDTKIISFIGRTARFLEKFDELDEKSYIRIIDISDSSKDGKKIISIKIRCLDPSIASSEIINNAYSSILMSATISPVTMYKDILDVKDVKLLELESPFLSKNQLTMVIEDVSTKYSLRNDDMYKKIAIHIENILKITPNKNTIIFFPSYVLLNKIAFFIDETLITHKILKETKFMDKKDKETFISAFKSKNKKHGKLLLAVTSGSFAEGLDLPDEALEQVIIVGLPLSVPDIYTNALINYFDIKFKQGNMYGYIQPAMNKIIQAGGRCIRTEKDRGIIILMDNRFLWPFYSKTFPKHWKLIKSKNYENEIRKFYNI